MKFAPRGLTSWLWLGVRMVVGIYLLTLVLMFFAQGAASLPPFDARQGLPVSLSRGI